MKTVRLTTKQFNDVIQSYPKEDLPCQVGGYPIRNQGLHKLPRYFENNLVGYLEDFDKNYVYQVFTSHVYDEDKSRCEICIEQMYSKGFISAEEYKLQLSDMIPEVMECLNNVVIMEDSKTLDDYLEDYSLITSSVLPLVAKELEKLYGQEAKK